jgi:hypothetical protein
VKNENYTSPSPPNDSPTFGEASANGEKLPIKPESNGQHQDTQAPARKGPRSQKPTNLQECPESAAPLSSSIEAPAKSGVEDPFSSENLLKMALSQDFESMAAVKPVFTTIAVAKPNRHEFIRVRNR